MRVLHVVAGGLSGGAARGALNLHRVMLDAGVDSYVLVQKGTPNNDPRIIEIRDFLGFLFVKVSSTLNALFNILLVRDYKTFPFNLFLLGIRLKKIKNINSEFDVIHLHWISGFVGLNTLNGIHLPVVWTMRDVWPATGGCHYPALGCKNYVSGCSHCPQLKYKELSGAVSRLNLLLKKRFIRKKKISLTAVSDWCSVFAKHTLAPPEGNITTIKNILGKNTEGIDSVIALPATTSKTGKNLTILTVALDFSVIYKGGALQRDAINAIFSDRELADSKVIVVGSISSELKVNHSSVTYTGTISQEHLNSLYLTADVYLTTSVYDAAPKTCLQALCAGLPLLAFDNSGHTELIEHMVNGYLAENLAVSDLICGLKWYKDLDLESKARVRNASKNFFRGYDHPETAINKYLEIYSRNFHV